MILNKILCWMLGCSSILLLSCSENFVKFTPEIGLPNCEIGMKKSDIPNDLVKSLGEKLIFDSEGELFAIANLTDEKYLIDSYSLKVGDFLKDSESKTKPLVYDSMSLQKKFSSNGGQQAISYPDGMIFDIDEKGKIVSFSLIAAIK